MRASLGVLFLAGCGFSHGALPGDELSTLVDDTSEDFTAGSTVDMAVDPLGLLAPDAFFPGGLHAVTYEPKNLVTPETTWSSLQAALPATTIGEGYGVLPVDWGGDRPYGVGIAPSRVDAFTLVVDGEIHLPAGRTTFALDGDDYAFIEIDVGGAFAGVHARFNQAAPTMTVDVPAEGWYPIRGAVSEAGGLAKLALSIIDGTTARPVGASELRARVTNARGVSVVASNDRLLGIPVAGIAVEPTLVERTFSNAPSYDFASLTGNNYSLRYAGQLRIDTEGLYGFALDVGADMTDYARLVIDGKAVAGRWPGQIDQAASDPVQLAPGWHDLILDYAQQTGTEKVTLTMSSPSGSAPIAADHLRPVRDGGLLAASVIATNVGLTDNGTKTIDLPMTAPGGATVEAVDVYFGLFNHPRTGMSVEIGDGSMTDPLALPAMPAYETYDAFPGRTAFANAPVDPMWKLVFTDADPANTGPYVYYPAIVASYRGGPEMPFATAMTYESATREVTGTVVDARAVGALDGVEAKLEVRTGTTDTIDAAAWQAPPLASEGLVQYRLSIASDGWHYPTVDRVELDVQP